MENMKKIIVIIIIIIALFLLILFLWPKNIYQFKGNTLNYASDRGKTDYEILSQETNGSIDIYRLRFKSRNFLDNPTIIYGLLFIPENKSNIPGIVFLPAGQATKEARSTFLMEIAKQGYAALAIDQRGIGETGGAYLSFEQDYQVFLEKKEPIQHLAVYDALRAFDVMREFKNINKGSIGFVGESMGGRYAIIATALEKRAKGVIAISASGFHIPINQEKGNNYMVSIDPDNYISTISPNQVIMLHGTNDSVVELEDAKITFEKAKEPKKFFTAEGCDHGYCDKMWNELKSDLGIMLNS